jgi:hypothetical protein
MGSIRGGGNFRLSINANMREIASTAGGTLEIQQINIGNNIIAEHQVNHNILDSKLIA